MLYFWWSCRGNLKLISRRSERVDTFLYGKTVTNLDDCFSPASQSNEASPRRKSLPKLPLQKAHSSGRPVHQNNNGTRHGRSGFLVFLLRTFVSRPVFDCPCWCQWGDSRPLIGSLLQVFSGCRRVFQQGTWACTAWTHQTSGTHHCCHAPLLLGDVASSLGYVFLAPVPRPCR